MINYPPVRQPINSRLSAVSMPPPPAPDTLFTGYTGIPGFIESAIVLSISSAAAWIGIRAGMDKGSSPTLKAAGWVGGVGSALLGLLYLGGKSGYNQNLSLPAVRVTPS
jgi:hypothetical protein